VSFPFSGLQQNKMLGDVCTFGIGGPARYFVEVKTVEEMQKILIHCKQENLPFFIIGKGSNCLFDDKGFNGVSILNKIDFFETPQPGTYYVGAGYSFSLLGVKSAREGWSGLEFASGIPASVGGAIFMNAGANGNETAAHLISVDFIDENGNKQNYKKKDLSFSYRTSPFQTMKGAVVGATFVLLPCSNARKKQLEIVDYRKKTQPYGQMSAGCVFRNPNCNHAGALIDICGLKGTSFGDAKVSELHGNFLINSGQATSRDMLMLIDYVKSQIKEKHGIELETEIRYVPFE
jgi:UDP-N-acetylmuramate dehydrogenase